MGEGNRDGSKAGEVAKTRIEFAPGGDVSEALGYMKTLIENFRDASNRLTLAANLYSAGARVFLRILGERGVSQLRIDAIAKALDRQTSASTLEAFLGKGNEVKREAIPFRTNRRGGL